MAKAMTLKELFAELERQGFHITATSNGWQVFNPAVPSGLVTIHASSVKADANRGYANSLAQLRRIGFNLPGSPEKAKSEGGEHTCPDCGRTFKQAHALGAHRYRSHGYRSPDYAKAKAKREEKVRQPEAEPKPKQKAPEPAPEKQAPEKRQETPLSRALTLETQLESALQQASAAAHELVLLVEANRTLHAGFEKLRDEHRTLMTKYDALVKRLEGVVESL